eukprot:3468873-Karenia_brevis.AAC.1
MEALQQQLGALAQRLDEVATQVAANTAEHQQMHPFVTNHQVQITDLNQRLVGLEAASTMLGN